jgi:hypothetical protein
MGRVEMEKWLLVFCMLGFFGFNEAFGLTEASIIEEAVLNCKTMHSQDAAARLGCFDEIAVDTVETTTEDPEREYLDGNYYLSSNQPNYLVWASPYEDDLLDDPHLEFFISTKYPLYYKAKSRAEDVVENSDKRYKWLQSPDSIFLVYNGLYDFYVSGDRYDSKPVISRMQNIGVIGEWNTSKPNSKIRIGWMHESNGQVIGETEAHIFDARRTEQGDDFALAGVSRGWDFLQVRYEKSASSLLQDYEENWWRYQLEFRSYFCDCQGIVFDKEDEIWWQPGNNASIAEFDGLRFNGEMVYTVNDNDFLMRAELKAGIRDLTNFGGKLTLGYKLGNARATLFYFNGFGKEPSTYHLRTKYFGFGLELR